MRHLAFAITLFLLTTTAKNLSAQGLSIAAGGMSVQSNDASTYAWSIDYRQNVSQHLAWSIGWLNEGHIADHRRDGFLAQIWGVLPLFEDRADIAIGAGLYNFFDTTDGANNRNYNIHNLAAIYSASATWYATPRWFFRATVNHIEAGGDNFNTTSYLASVGYWLGSRPHGESRTAPQPDIVAMQTPRFSNRNEITLLAGNAVINNRSGQNSFAAQLEYRRLLSAHVDWTVAYLNEGTGRQLKRNGVTTQFWLAGRFYSQRLQVAFGAGAYWTFESSNEVEGWQAISGIVSPTVSYRLTNHWLMRFTWNRVISSYDRDADNFLLGAGYTW